ncbi:DNA polymerase III subunit gamma and tau, partial [Streptomyces rapamycinicus]|uniref:DNA polymerase III subunit gamma and tau n=1 Tax=Streptomyces rapamycinicus TaxID=1226757 RepID=UPI003B8A8212
MSSLALYRRYRPETFAEVIGQEHVTGPLQQALRNNRVNHAYLFSGPRGCGKTTSARILARCLNCEKGPTPAPCGECQSCQDLARNGPGSIDVIEIDAASHGGVDDARELREKAFFGPASSRYKIYIIDEAHMVTSAGFNALLKVVEEPPEHLKFIFATTEPEKVIGTIRSRTHHYPFRLVPPGTLRDYLGEVCGREAIPIEDGVLPLVVRAGAGSVRDSMSVMDQLLAGAADDGVTYAMATSLLGYTDGSLLDSIVDAFAASDGAAAFEVVNRVIEGGNDPRRFVADLLERLRDLVILAAVPDAAEKGLIDAPADVVERMQAQASVFGGAELSRAADLVNEGLTEMRGATSPRLQLELICARVLLPAAFDDERSVQSRLERLERGALAGGLGGGAGAAGAGAGGVGGGVGGGGVGGPGPAMGYVPGPDAHAPRRSPGRWAVRSGRRACGHGRGRARSGAGPGRSGEFGEWRGARWVACRGAA